jgi:2-polyprenyl-6-methoxyphenol hydroxylase-like FAD-dependent oxidoreductase
LLSRDGHQVQVFERTASLGPVGAGFLLQPAGQRVLWELGLLESVLAHGAVISRLYGETAAGRPVMDMRYGELDRRLFGIGLQRGALFSILDAAWTESRMLHCDSQVVAVDPDAGTVTLADGRRHNGFDLVVVADGAASGLRSQIAPSRLDRAYPWGAQWCLVPAGNWTSKHVLEQRYVGARRMAGMLPVGTRPGDSIPRLSFFWSLPVAELSRGGVDAAAWRADVAKVWPAALERLEGLEIPTGL